MFAKLLGLVLSFWFGYQASAGSAKDVFFCNIAKLNGVGGAGICLIFQSHGKMSIFPN